MCYSLHSYQNDLLGAMHGIANAIKKKESDASNNIVSLMQPLDDKRFRSVHISRFNSATTVHSIMIILINPFTADHINALHFAILV